MRKSRLIGVWAALVLCACGGKARSGANSGGESGISSGDASSNAAGVGSDAAGAGANAGGTDSGSGGAVAACPASEPTEGAACSPAGQQCMGYGSLSCPETALCVAGTWQIHCPATMLGGGACGCAHHTFGKAPIQHRAQAAGCAQPRGSVNGCVEADGVPNIGCSDDAECTAGKNGRCMQTRPGGSCGCSYDECSTDSDCDKGSVCQCRDSSDTNAPTYCTKANNCRTDVDCGAEGYCSPSEAHEWCRASYVCHTAQDECLDDADCGPVVPCDFDARLQHWACGNGCGGVLP